MNLDRFSQSYETPVIETVDDINNCGCGKQAEWLVYEDKQPHCSECFREATECGEMVEVQYLCA
ncbi:hypothetical protein [Chengkuizengella axinellae]|uniref:Uncharacterized protein n=1 Tax=Chengkuizengella axinellae TaxID=3064388 RepID=A0ABT9IXA6_9BACL|nr:hypothetical protein [Chengkuizengella sp. 2205SS18-9]MDP5273996.1 hypothetical protein [Chengkuizengella sp. 2205SS18-9]